MTPVQCAIHTACCAGSSGSCTGFSTRQPTRSALNNPGDIHPSNVARAGACYAQIVLCEDVSVHSALAVGSPLALTNWAGRTGLSELPPLVGPIDWRAWTCRVRLADMAALRAYAQAVHAMTDTYLATLADDAFDPAHEELPGRLLSALLLTMAMRHGEIACLLSTAWRAAPG